MKIFAIADLHLSFAENINKPMDIFGSAWENYEERLKAAWLEMVSQEDLVLIPGDISWGMKLEEALPDLDWIDKLPGTKLIGKGNHDLWWASGKKMTGLYNSIFFMHNDAYVDKERHFAVIGSRGWICPGDQGFSEDDEKIFRRENLRIGMSHDDFLRKIKPENPEDYRLFAMLHFPPTNPSKVNSDITKTFSEWKVSDVVYGHLHTAKAFPNGIEGSVNGVNYKLVSLDKLNCIPYMVAEI